MANIAITSDAWTEISITSGTVQNISATADIELSAEQTDNSGVVLKPSELYQWDNETIYARAVTEDTGALRVVNFKRAAGGGGYVLPVASASTLGGVKVGNNLSINASGVLSATGGGGAAYSTTEQLIGTWTDGKPLYQITVSETLPSTEDADVVVYTMESNCKVVNFDAIIYKNNGVIVVPYFYDSSYYYINMWFFNNVLYMKQRNFASESCYITIKYTKTTD